MSDDLDKLLAELEADLADVSAPDTSTGDTNDAVLNGDDALEEPSSSRNATVRGADSDSLVGLNVSSTATSSSVEDTGVASGSKQGKGRRDPSLRATSPGFTEEKRTKTVQSSSKPRHSRQRSMTPPPPGNTSSKQPSEVKKAKKEQQQTAKKSGWLSKASSLWSRAKNNAQQAYDKYQQEKAEKRDSNSNSKSHGGDSRSGGMSGSNGGNTNDVRQGDDPQVVVEEEPVRFKPPTFPYFFRELPKSGMPEYIPPPEDAPLHERTFWLLRNLAYSMDREQGAYITPRLYVPQHVWYQENVRVIAYSLKCEKLAQLQSALIHLKSTADFYSETPTQLLKPLQQLVRDMRDIQNGLAFQVAWYVCSLFVDSCCLYSFFGRLTVSLLFYVL